MTTNYAAPTPDQEVTLRKQNYLHLKALVAAAESVVARAELALAMANERLDPARRYRAEALLADLTEETIE